MNRRRFVQVMAGTAISLEFATMGSQRPAGAQETADLAGLGLPELTVTLTDAAYEVSPATTPAGWTLVTFDNQQSEGHNSADIMLLPAGESIDSFVEMLSAMGPEDAPPDWIYETVFAGAPWKPAGESGHAVVLLTEGDWAIFSPAPLAPAALTVTAGDAAPAAPADLSADLAIEMGEFFFTGLAEPIPGGPQIWEVTTTGVQPHHMTVSRLPDGATQEQLMASFVTMMTGTPAPDALDPASMANVGGCSTLSAGQSLYLALDLAAGTYGAVCFFPDPETGAPHVMLGMAQVFTAG